MGTKIEIDFRHIRPFDGDRRKGFEEFVCQLARYKPPANPGEFRRVEGSGGDGGVEAYWTDAQGKEHGVQAKYFLATKEIDWAQIDKSVDAALIQHPALVSYSIAIACDLTDRSGAQGKGKTGWQRWEARRAVWQSLAIARGLHVNFSVWTKSDMVNELASHADRRGLTLFWFNEDILDEARLNELFGRARADLGERFHPEDNVSTSLAKAVEGMRRSPAFVQNLAAWFNQIPSADDLLSSFDLLSSKPPRNDTGGSSMCVPHAWIGRQLGLRPDFEQIGACKNAAGEVVFLDPAYGSEGISSGVIEPRAFFNFLSSQGLECIWIVAGERNAYPSGKTGDYYCRSFAGLHRFRDGRWSSVEWHDDTSS